MRLATKKEKKFIDKAAYFVGIMFPIFTIPQVYQLYTSKEATGISLLTWVAYSVLTVMFLIYALVDKIKPLIIAELVWIFIDVLMVIGIIIYK